MAKTLDDIFNDDDYGLLNARESRRYVSTDEDRLIDAFEEINLFYEKNDREPARTSMAEYTLYARLNDLRKDAHKKSVLKPFDRFNLLGAEEIVVAKSIDDILNSDDLGLLDNEGDDSIFDFVHTPKSGTRADAEYIAQRKAMPESKFARYDSMFKQVHRELKEGKRKLLPFSDAEKNLIEGNFYLVDGLLAYLETSDAEKVLKENKSGTRVRLEGRTVTIFENGTISNMLFRSLAKAIQKNGKMITDTDENIQNQLAQNVDFVKEELQSGWIYVLRSKSENPQLTNVKDLYKVGFSKQLVQERIKNAFNEATYLFSDVEIIATYNCWGVDIQALENLLHRFFGEVCLNIDIYDANGVRYVPREWFCVPLEQINEAIELVQNNTIFNYRYDDKQKRIVLK